MARPTVVLLHGVGLDRSVWEPLTELIGGRYDVVALDLPGHGSRPPVSAGITLSDLADGVAESIPAGAHVVGFSLGALVAQHLAVHRPGLVRTLTCVSSVCDRTPDERTAVLARLRVAEAALAASSEASISRWYDGTDVPDAIVAHTREVLLANDEESFLACYRVFATADAEIAPHLGSIAVPTLAITGAEDPGSTPEMSRRLAAAVPGASAVIVPGARHMLPVQDPAALAAHLTAFIGESAHV
ncbi:Pimeloyl-ACP methyl ester carboxylesterase [Nocardioides sp. YR527]|uniref:alpha/beta fold hydrolase n=1 Tax=Nocardioides sp. YR527 TaxID=1881028 RepID=UPI000885927F|nr:alpha/beta fold hydrolase [Nocardioides sp. YR527]SDJ96736.1 Pimeloyl-ACP methyl ester carboxylesterase [Nocardioides sp. YR527]